MTPHLTTRAALAATLLAGLLTVPAAQAGDTRCDTSTIADLLAGGDTNLAELVADLEDCFGAVDAPCPPAAVAGVAPWEYYFLGLRDPILPGLYYLASWSGVTYYDARCNVVGSHCYITVSDGSWFETVSAGSASITHGSYKGLPTAGGQASCGATSASVYTYVGGVLPLYGYTV